MPVLAQRTSPRYRRSTSLKALDGPTVLLGGITIVAFVLMYAPMVIIGVFSFAKTTIAALPLQGLTWRWYEELFRDPDAASAAWTTLVIAIGALILSTAIGVPLAFAAFRSNFLGKGMITKVLYVPVVLPGLLNGFVFLNYLTFLDRPLGVYAVVIVHGTVLAAIMFSMTYARLIRLDPLIEEAAHDLGASRRQTLLRVHLPALKTTLIGGWLLVFMLSLDDLLATFFLLGDGFNIQMLVWSRLRVQLTPSLHALSTVLFIISIVVVLAYSALLERERRQGY